MPYRRLPNTDKARLAALEKAVAMEHECDVDKQAASYKTLNEARVLLRLSLIHISEPTRH